MKMSYPMLNWKFDESMVKSKNTVLEKDTVSVKKIKTLCLEKTNVWRKVIIFILWSTKSATVKTTPTNKLPVLMGNHANFQRKIVRSKSPCANFIYIPSNEIYNQLQIVYII